MKKWIALLLALAMLLSLVACGGNAPDDKDDRDEDDKDIVADTDEEEDEDEDEAEADAGEGENAEAEENPDTGVDFEAEGQQILSDDRADMDVLVETRDVWLEGRMTFALDAEPKTYEDFVEHIGCEAAYYEYKPEDGERWYTWIAADDESAQFVAVFWETGSGWTLYSVGSVNIG